MTEIEATHIDHKGKIVAEDLRRLKDENHSPDRIDGEVYAGHPSNLSRPRTSGIHHNSPGVFVSFPRCDSGDPATLLQHPGALIMDITDTHAPGLLNKSLKRSVRVQVTVFSAKGCPHQPLRVQIGKDLQSLFDGEKSKSC